MWSGGHRTLAQVLEPGCAIISPLHEKEPKNANKLLDYLNMFIKLLYYDLHKYKLHSIRYNSLLYDGTFFQLKNKLGRTHLILKTLVEIFLNS